MKIQKENQIDREFWKNFPRAPDVPASIIVTYPSPQIYPWKSTLESADYLRITMINYVFLYFFFGF